MFRRLRKLFHREIGGLHEAAYLIGIASLGSQLLALVRDRLLANTFGAGSELDIYYAAFRVPDLLYATIASFVSVNVLIPFLVQWIGPKSSNDSVKAQTFLSNILTVFVCVMGATIALVYIFSPGLAQIAAPGFAPEAQEKLSMLLRVLMLSPFFLGISNIIGGVTQSLKRFYLYALSPLVYNLGIIIGIVFFYPTFGLSGLAFGVVLGALLHMSVQLPLLKSAEVFPMLTTKIEWKEVRAVIVLSAPRTLALALGQISLAVLSAFASYMTPGSIAVFTFAYTLQSVPLSLIGVSYSVAAFPTLSRLFAEGEHDRFVRQVVTALRHIIFLSLPVTALFLVLRVQIVQVILGSGRFTPADTALTAAAMALYVLSLFGQSFVLLFTRSYYAAGNTQRPLSVNFLSSVVTIIAAAPFVWMFKTVPVFSQLMERTLDVVGIPGTLVLMLPLADSFGNIVNASVLWVVFGRDFKMPFRALGRTFAESLLGAITLGGVTGLVLPSFQALYPVQSLLGSLLPALGAGLAGIGAAILALYLLGSQELREVLREARTRLPLLGR